MTTDVYVTSTLDLSVNNEVINLGSVPLPEGKVLAGAYWFIVGYSVYETLLAVLRFVYRLIERRLPDHEVWLFVGNSAWQPDTRIARYRKLWGALTARGIEVTHTCKTQEIMHEEEGKLKFFGVTQLSELSIKSVVKVLLDEHCSYLVALPRAVETGNILDMGWSGNLFDDFELIDVLIKNDGLLIKRSGEFDDEEKGIVGIGQPALISLLIN